MNCVFVTQSKLNFRESIKLIYRSKFGTSLYIFEFITKLIFFYFFFTENCFCSPDIEKNCFAAKKCKYLNRAAKLIKSREQRRCWDLTTFVFDAKTERINLL